MSKAILIDAMMREQPRIAITEKHHEIIYLDLEANKVRTKGNIYLGVVSKITNAFEAAFVDYGNDKHGFLSFKDLAPAYKTQRDDGSEQINIKEGQKLLVQIEKERRGDKGAALTTLISLAGSYLVIMPGNAKCNGISKRIDVSDREQTKVLLDQLSVEKNTGLIIRTAGVGQNIADLTWDLDSLTAQWHAIEKAASEYNNPTLIHQESDSVLRCLRDQLRGDISKIIVNDEKTFEHVKSFIERTRPDFLEKVIYYDNVKAPLFTHYQIEPQIERLFEKKIDLKSGGSIIIEQCEALTAIDVNSGGATQGQDIEETAYRTNLEAVEAAASQIKLRNISGIIDIDLIDMTEKSKRLEIEKALQKAFQNDRSKIKTESISSLTGCLRISRQRNGASVSETHEQSCSHCDGTGRTRTISTFCSQLLRKVEENIAEESTDIVMLQVSIDTCSFIINELRSQLDRLQKTYNTYVMVVPNEHLPYPKYLLKRMRMPAGATLPSSIEERTQPAPAQEAIPSWSTAHKREQPKVKHTLRSRGTNKENTQGLVKQFVSWIFSSSKDQQEERKPDQRRPRRPSSTRRYRDKDTQSSPHQRRSRGPRRVRHDKQPSHHTSHHTKRDPNTASAYKEKSQTKSMDILDD